MTAICQARLKGQKIRKNAVYAVEGVMSASPAYFRPDSPERYGHYEPARLEAWTDASMNWLREKYGDRVISAVLPLDEATMHLQFLILPLEDKGRLNFGLDSAAYAPTTYCRPVDRFCFLRYN